jgi:predicted CoA-substrate-specific enzyme activase
MAEHDLAVAGMDVGTECVKAVIMDGNGILRGRAVVPTGGYFQDRCQEAMAAALDEAQVNQAQLGGICATGFGKTNVTSATQTCGETSCHALGAHHYFPREMCVVDIGGREPRVIQVTADGKPQAVHTLRRCALGIGTFLMFAARHLDVHPTQLQELAASVDRPAAIGSYCSVFASSEILDRLREGESREAIALGCLHSIAERIVEIGQFSTPLVITGGVVEYFPGVISAFCDLTKYEVEVVPEPILTGAVGAAKMAQGATQTDVKLEN